MPCYSLVSILSVVPEMSRVIGRTHGSGANGGEITPEQHAFAMAGWLMREGEMLTQKLRGGPVRGMHHRCCM